MIEYLGSDLANKDAAGADGLQAMIDAVHPDDAAQFTAMLDRSLAYGESFALRHRLRRADGVYRWMSSRAEPVRDDDGHITQWYGLCHDIDDQVRAEEALRLSEWRLRQLIDTVPVMIWSTSPEGTPTYVSRRFTDVTGAGIKDVTGADGKPSLSIIHPGDRAGAAEAVAGSWRTGIPYLAQYRQIRRDGSFRWTESRAAPLRDESGEILQWYGVSVDIHDLVIAQEALRDRERELLQLVDMVPSLLWRLSADGEPVFFSRRMIEYLGLDVADADKAGRDRLSAIVAAVVHPDDAPRLDETLKRSLATGEHFSMRFRLRRADGVYRWVEGRAEPLWGEDGEILQWYGLCHDVDDQMQAEEALRQGERSLRQLVETLPAMLYCATPAGEPTYRSQRLREFLGFELDEKDESGKSRLTVTLDAVIHPDDLPLVKEKYAHSLATGEPYALRHRLRRFDGEWRWVETRAAAMRDANGAIVQWNGVCLEIDDEVRAQEELRVAEETLARAGQASTLAELSASIAHEVNQPLGAVVANAHACQRWLTAEPPNLERALMTAQWIIRDANAAADVVSRIRALFRQTVQPRTCTSLRPVIAEVRRWIADLALKNRVLIETDIDAELPAVSIDQVQIQQVLINLARNAVEAMEGIEGARILTVGARRSGDAVQVEVRDRGRGVQHADRIFDAFFTTKESGLGMGLAISRSIVESHGGRLWVESNEADGSRFIFTLPIEASGSS
jgi:PAS domain S-box-containing protein